MLAAPPALSDQRPEFGVHQIPEVLARQLLPAEAAHGFRGRIGIDPSVVLIEEHRHRAHLRQGSELLFALEKALSIFHLFGDVGKDRHDAQNIPESVAKRGDSDRQVQEISIVACSWIGWVR